MREDQELKDRGWVEECVRLGMESLYKPTEVAEGEIRGCRWVISLTRLLLGKPLLDNIVWFLCPQPKFSLRFYIILYTGDMVVNKGYITPALL